MTLPEQPFPTHYPPVTGQDLPPEPEPEPAQQYAIVDMIALSGASPKQVDHWTRAGYLHPVARENATNGVRRRWPQRELDVCTRMAMLVDLGLSVTLAHEVARHGTYANGRVSIRLTGPEQTASAADREVLRAPGRTAVLHALIALRDEATAAAELLGLDAIGFDGQPLSETYAASDLVQMGEIITGSDHKAVTGE